MTNDVILEPERDPALIRIADRAVTAGIDAAWSKWQDGSGDPWLRIAIPSGRKKKEISIRPNEAERFEKMKFEEWVALAGYNAILDKAGRKIVAHVRCQVNHSMAFMALPGFENVPEPDYGEAGEDSDAHESPHATALNTPSRSRLQLRIDDVASRLALVFRTWDLHEDLQIIFGTATSSNFGLTIENVSTDRHDEALEMLQKLSLSLFFEIDATYGIILQLVKPSGSSRYEQPNSSRITRKPTFPRFSYERDAIELYFYARESSLGLVPVPLVSYLAYYQVLEYYMPTYSQIHLLRRLKNALKDPRLDPDDDVAVGRLLTFVAGAGSQAGEREQLRLTVEACVEDDELREYISESGGMLEFLSDKKGISNVRVLQLQDKQVTLVGQVADRVYDLRCRIVHSKESNSGTLATAPLLPFSTETSRLAYDIDLIRFLARKILVASGRSINLQ